MSLSSISCQYLWAIKSFRKGTTYRQLEEGTSGEEDKHHSNRKKNGLFTSKTQIPKGIENMWLNMT